MISRPNGFSMAISSFWATDNLCSWCHIHLEASFIYIVDSYFWIVSWTQLNQPFINSGFLHLAHW